MNLISLLTLPAIIKLRDNDGARFTIAGIALVILIGAVAYSKRSSGGLGATEAPASHAAASA
jgi:K(+)-stimulated pyrophosphate-energized sodium pump